MSRGRKPAGTYPTWIAVMAFAVIGVVWGSTREQEREAPEATPPAKAVVPVPDATTPPAPAPSLQWRIEGTSMPSAAELEGCLREEGLTEFSVAGTPQNGLTIHHRQEPKIQHLTPMEDTVVVRTPLDASANRTARRHVLATVCLYGADAVVVDEVHGRRKGTAWPQLGASGGLPIETVVALRRQGRAWTTQGLETLGRRELGITFDPGSEDAAQLVLRKAAAAILGGAPGTTRLSWSQGRARLVSSIAASSDGWWTGPTAPTLWVLAEVSGPSRALRLTAPAPPKKVTPARPPSRKPIRRPVQPKKGFWPDYR